MSLIVRLTLLLSVFYPAKLLIVNGWIMGLRSLFPQGSGSSILLVRTNFVWITERWEARCGPSLFVIPTFKVKVQLLWNAPLYRDH